MTSADFTVEAQIKRAHRGGFFWTVDRSLRMKAILEVASTIPRFVVLAGSESEARDVSQRLTLRGVPVLLASNPDNPRLATSFEQSAATTFVTTADYVVKHGPISSPLTVHLRPPFSVRSYIKRLNCSRSAVHVTFVTPEDEQRADELRSSLSPESGPLAKSEIDLVKVLDLTSSGRVAGVDTPRRRFAFRAVPAH